MRVREKRERERERERKIVTPSLINICHLEAYTVTAQSINSIVREQLSDFSANFDFRGLIAKTSFRMSFYSIYVCLIVLFALI